jgi:hypothetical protein
LATGGGLGLLVARSLKAADANAKLAARLGLTTESVAALQHAAGLAGVDVRTLELGIQRLVRRTGDAAMGNKELNKTFDKLGISSRELAKLEPDKMLERVLRAVQRFPRPEALALFQKLVDSEGIKAINITADSIEEARKRVKATGQALSAIDSRRIEMANDAIFRLQGVVSGVGQRIAVELTPFIVKAADAFDKWLLSGGSIEDVVSKGMDSVIGKFVTLGRVWDGLRVVWANFIGGVAQGMSLIQRSVALLEKSQAGFALKDRDFGRAKSLMRNMADAEKSAKELDAFAASQFAKSDELMRALGNNGGTGFTIGEALRGAQDELTASVTGKKTQQVQDEYLGQKIDELIALARQGIGVRLN